MPNRSKPKVRPSLKALFHESEGVEREIARARQQHSEKVNAIAARLREAGYTVVPPSQTSASLTFEWQYQAVLYNSVVRSAKRLKEELDDALKAFASNVDADLYRELRQAVERFLE